MLWDDHGRLKIKVPVFLALIVVDVRVRVALGVLAPGVVLHSLMAPSLGLGLLTLALPPSLALSLAFTLILDHLPIPPRPPTFPRRSVRFGYALGWPRTGRGGGGSGTI
jgi:hypothetical protein